MSKISPTSRPGWSRKSKTATSAAAGCSLTSTQRQLDKLYRGTLEKQVDHSDLTWRLYSDPRHNKLAHTLTDEPLWTEIRAAFKKMIGI